jgi:hypothetical protein
MPDVSTFRAGLFGGAFVLFAVSVPLRAQNLLVNGNLDDPGTHEADVATGWTLTEGPDGPLGPTNTATFASFANHTPAGADPTQVGLWCRSFEGGLGGDEPSRVFAHLQQTVPGVPGAAYTMSGWARFETFYAGGVDNLNDGATPTVPNDGPPSPTDTFFALEFLDAGSTLLSSVQVELRANGQLNDGTWREHTLNGVSPAGTALVRVRASMIDGALNPGVNPQSAFVDDFTLVPEPASLGLLSLAGLRLLARRRRSQA